MSQLIPFKALRAKADLAERIAARPYDVLNAEEAAAECAGNALSFYHVSKSEIDLPAGTDDHSDAVYEKAATNFAELKQQAVFEQDETDCYYLYRLIMNGRSQTGWVGCLTVDDYFNDVIKKHEFTRPVKENDRIRHTEALRAHTGPIFNTFHDVQELNEISASVQNGNPAFDFTAADGIRHTGWVISEAALVKRIKNLFAEKVPAIYIADGHHRAATGAKVGRKMAEQNPNHTGTEEYNHFLSVNFPASETLIMDYNRVVRDLNGHSKDSLLSAIEEKFSIEKSAHAVKPSAHYTFGMYLDKQWYRLSAKAGSYNDQDPVKKLDISVLSDNLLDPVLGVKDQRTDNRIDFVGGIRGLAELERRVDNGNMQIAFSIPPVSIQQLMEIADSGNVMPPKTTWFEPKLRDGLFVHEF